MLKLGDKLSYQVETKSNGFKWLTNSLPEKDSSVEIKEFIIIAVDKKHESYYVLLDDDMVGHIISKFHTKHYGVDEKFLGKKFLEIKECSDSVDLILPKLETPVPLAEQSVLSPPKAEIVETKSKDIEKIKEVTPPVTPTTANNVISEEKSEPILPTKRKMVLISAAESAQAAKILS